MKEQGAFSWTSGGCLLLVFIVLLLLFTAGAGFSGMLSSRGENGLGPSDLSATDIPEPYRTIFTKAGDKWNVRPEFIAAIFLAGEHHSGGEHFNPNTPWPDENGPWASSSKGAQGPFQFMPATWKSNEQDGNGDGDVSVQNLWDASFGAAHLLANIGAGGNTDELESLKDAASRYNSGRPWSKGQSLKETRPYVTRVIEAFRSFSSQVSSVLGGCEVASLMLKYGSSRQEVESQLVPIQFAGKTIRVHQKVASAFRAVDRDIKLSSAPYQFRDLGTFNWRQNVNNPSELSSHSFGIAIDINPKANPNRPDNVLVTDLPAGVVNAFKKHGFRWGGEYQSIKDAMHFEYCR